MPWGDCMPSHAGVKLQAVWSDAVGCKGFLSYRLCASVRTVWLTLMLFVSTGISAPPQMGQGLQGFDPFDGALDARSSRTAGERPDVYPSKSA